MDDRIVIPITDQNYLELIRELENLLDQIMATNERSLIRYCKYVETIPTEYYRSSFILIWREAIELVDSIKSLVALSSCNTIPILLRSLFELNLGIAFICSDENKIKQRALAYGGISLIRRIENYKKFDPTNLEYMEFRDCIGIDIVSKFDKDFDYKGATDNLSSIFEKYPAYKEFKEEYDRIFEQKKQCGRKQVRPEWYELFDGKSSIFSLAEMLGLKKYYITLYDQFSLKGHGNNAMSAWEPSALKNPKVPNLKELASSIDLTLTFITGIATDILKAEFSAEYQYYGRKHLQLRKQIEKFSEVLNNISFQTEQIIPK